MEISDIFTVYTATTYNNNSCDGDCGANYDK